MSINMKMRTGMMSMSTIMDTGTMNMKTGTAGMSTDVMGMNIIMSTGVSIAMTNKDFMFMVKMVITMSIAGSKKSPR